MSATAKYGLHVHQGSDNPKETEDTIIEMIRTGLLVGVLILNNPDFANRCFRAGCRTVIHRVELTGKDAYPWIAGDESDIQRGRNWFHNAADADAHARLDPGVYMQPRGMNEANRDRDAWFCLGIMQEATAAGRRLAVFCDGVGWPNLIVTGLGTVSSPVWELRVSTGCMAYGLAHGHLACVHEYGAGGKPEFTGNEPGCAIWPDGHRQDGQYFWFGGRHVVVWQMLIPAASRMKVVRGECGTFNADWEKAGGPVYILNDFKGYQWRSANDPWLVANMLWTCGGKNGYGFDSSDIDPELPILLSYLRSLL